MRVSPTDLVYALSAEMIKSQAALLARCPARLDVRRVGGAPERRHHLLGDREQRVADDPELDPIDVGSQGAGGDGRGRHGPAMGPRPAAGSTISRVTRQGGWPHEGQ